MNKLRFIVYRQEKLIPENFTLIEADTDDSISTSKQLVEAVRQGVTRWAKETPQGQSVYLYAEDDMNVGDLMTNCDDNDMQAIVDRTTNVHSLRLFGLDANMADSWNYDTPLCEYIEDDNETGLD